jgi:hypothetical protein
MPLGKGRVDAISHLRLARCMSRARHFTGTLLDARETPRDQFCQELHREKPGDRNAEPHIDAPLLYAFNGRVR